MNDIDPLKRDAELLRTKFDDFAGKHGLTGDKKTGALKLLRTLSEGAGDGRAVFLLGKPEVRAVLAECFGPGQRQTRALNPDGSLVPPNPVD